MRVWIWLAVAPFVMAWQTAEAEQPGTIYASVSPLIAHNFWRDIGDLTDKGITITPEIAAQVCASKAVGDFHQCRPIQVTDPIPINYVQGYGVAIRDGDRSNLMGDGEAWVSMDYYVYYMNKGR